MYTMIREAERKNLPFTREDLVEKGRSIVLFPGVRDWFRRINAFGEEPGGPGGALHHLLRPAGDH